MSVNESVIFNSEKLIFSLRSLYVSRGYSCYRMSKFEEYDLYANNKDFLVSDNVITFTDTNGKLMALKPDVTLSIIKNSKDTPDETRRLCYNENVYRVGRGANSFGESMQIGLECFGTVPERDAAAVILLAAESLSLLSENRMLAISDLSLLEDVIDAGGISGDAAARLFRAIGSKNMHEIRALCEECGAAETADRLQRLLSVGCAIGDAEKELPEIKGTSLGRILAMLSESPEAGNIRLDFSVTADINYYNGIIFNGFVGGIPDEVLSGGMYSKLMRKLHRKSDAIGFAVYADRLERIDRIPEDDGFLNVALPKGRLGEKVYARFAEAGFECPSVLENSRKLIFENAEKKVRYFWVKPSDVAIYVERGAADIGVAGKDILLEYNPDVFELLDLDTGKCRMCVAAPKSFTDNGEGTLRVATKFANIAKDYYGSVGRDIDIIHLNGSIEIAPILGLSDVIVDIVETGTTLKENDLEVKEEIVNISARLIANKASCRFKRETVEKVAEGLKK
ncbi:MAG: ATP phosphoribosyltransferase [Clostridia bacterium]|nr:ATP phosphoribosyltransferase [Clostridia bacterium]